MITIAHGFSDGSAVTVPVGCRLETPGRPGEWHDIPCTSYLSPGVPWRLVVKESVLIRRARLVLAESGVDKVDTDRLNHITSQLNPEDTNALVGEIVRGLVQDSLRVQAHMLKQQRMEGKRKQA